MDALDQLTVRYSMSLSFFLGSHIASRSNSNPRTKMSVPTIITGINSMIEGPIIITRKVKAASMKPAIRESPPDLMKNMVLA